MLGEDVFVALPLLEALDEVGRDLGDVGVHLVPGTLAGDDHLREVLVEHVADDADRQIRFAVQQRRRVGRLGLRLDALPHLHEALDVGAQLLLGSTLGGGADDDARVGRHDLLEDALEARALGVGQLAADARHRVARHEDDEASR